MFFLFSCNAQQNGSVKITPIENSQKSKHEPKEEQELIVGAERFDTYAKYLKGKKIGVVANQTSRVGEEHLVDFLIDKKLEILKVFSPEHGFRGEADAGEKVDSEKDEKTGLPIVSLYGNNKKPSASQLADIEVLIFDIQDVGARFYTYISTLHYVMEASAEQNISVLVLDRPNPHGNYIDGPVRKDGYKSFVGMHPIPIIHGMTIGEYALMINGEGWLNDDLICDLTIISCRNYDRNTPYDVPVSPSPNLRSFAAIQLYPSLCLFEGTQISVGRGTDKPFEVFGHPNFQNDSLIFTYSFTPKPSFGAKNPKLKNKQCYGKNLRDVGERGLQSLNIEWLIQAYKAYSGDDFFITKNKWFDLLAGSDELRKSIEAGHSIKEIRSSWEKDLEEFSAVREKYLMYE